MKHKNILFNKTYLKEPSLFKPENLLREARRQKNLPNCQVPNVCILDPDGDIVHYLLSSGQAVMDTCWSCYHTKMYQFTYQDLKMGIIGQAVGSSYAVLLAEQLFVSGCKLLISVASAGIINKPSRSTTRFILIEEALRDEGTSYHYLKAGMPSKINSTLLAKIQPLTKTEKLLLEPGKSWTTDAPYRETAAAISFARSQGVISVEMEAAALYAFAQAKQKSVICFAHLTNQMAQDGVDFEKGLENGSLASLKLIAETCSVLNGVN